MVCLHGALYSPKENHDFSSNYGSNTKRICINGKLDVKVCAWKDVCVCYSHWEGMECQMHWREEEFFISCVFVYQMINGITFALLSFFCAKEMLRIRRNNQSHSVATFTLSLAALGCLVRFISFTIDPHAIYGFVSLSTYTSATAIAVFSWLSSCYGVCLHWMGVCRYQEYDKDSLFARKLRPVLYTLLVTMWIVLWILHDRTMEGPRYVATMFFLFVTVVITLIYGLTIRSQLSPFRAPFAIMLRHRVTRYITALSSIFIVISSCNAAQIMFGHSKYPFLVIVSINRVAEVSLIISWLLLFQKFDLPDRMDKSYSSSLSILGDTYYEKQVEEEEEQIRGDSEDEADERPKPDETSCLSSHEMVMGSGRVSSGR
ncbi:hypothetical protein PROFUN_01605 [Planoprotostelium fungivorum]|uniref:Uncharacterized protein n=1 Tax=Planoprotostelium fungivorum TaxID=1890364 RepID=A0A2P6NTP6_9EUKA|nr:hypothetical protein PROFUN_01605 [Planoprotostelium fungivorum]